MSCLLASLLGACGGGGGGGSSPPTPIGTAPPTGANPPATGTPGTPPPSSTPQVLTFSAPIAGATVEAGRSAAISADAVVTTPADFATASAVYAYIIDTNGVILPQVQITQTGTYSYRAVMQTVPSLAAGKYSGNFAVKVCRDANCAQQFPGSPMQLPYEITVTAPVLPVVTALPVSNLDLTINTGKAAPDPLSVRVSAAGRTWTATTEAKWITLLDASGSGDGAFRVKYDVSALALGMQTSNIVVKASDGQSVVLPVKAQLLPVAFSVDRNQITFTAINGAPIAAEAVKFNVADGAVTWAASTNVPWLGITPTGGPTPGITTLKVDPAAGNLASGQYAGLVTISAPGVQTSTVPVTLNLSKATFKASSASITLGGTYGREHDQAAVSLNLNTLGNAHPWSLSAIPAWLGASAVSGQVSQTGASVNFSQILGALPTGTSVAALTATAKVNGDVLTTPITVTANRDAHKLLFSETGVAFASTPTWSRLSRTVTVSDNFGQASGWSASSDQPWLALSRNGKQLTLSANPASLPDNAISYATVKLMSDDTTISTAETLRVALWKGSTTPGSIKKLNKSYMHLKTDPIRPYLYANAGGTGIDVYNVYTAALVGTIGNLGGALGEMSVSQNGATLYAYDTANRNIVVIDLATMTKTATWPLASSIDHFSKLLAVRPNGVQLVIARDGMAYDAATGLAVGTTGINPVAATTDGKRTYSAGGVGFDIDFSAMAGGTLFSKLAGSNAGDDVAVSGDGSRLYMASGAPYRCRRISPTDFSEIGNLPGGEHYPNNVEVGSDGRVYCGISGWYSSADVWVHSAEGAILNSFKFAGYAQALTAGSMQISGDGLIMVGQTDDPFLVFVPVGP
ncbi:BACON domain-containing protein [Telluria sp. B2]